MSLMSVTLGFSMADALSVSAAMRLFIAPVMSTLCIMASLLSAGFLVYGGFHYMTSSGDPQRLGSAKNVMKNAVLGLLLVLAAGLLTDILVHAYSTSGSVAGGKLPSIAQIKPAPTQANLADVLIGAISTLLADIAQTITAPFMTALAYFTNSTPLMADNSSVFNLWLATVGIADALLVLIVGMLGFHVMSMSTLGLGEIEFKHLIPRLALAFLLVNSSLFLIDSMISLSNAMIHALQAGFPSTSVWSTLAAVTRQTSVMSIATLIIMVVFLSVSVFLLVYYVGRIISLYLGAVLAPLVILLWLLPAFKDFAETAAKLYVIVIFVLFVQVVILQLATSMFSTLLASSSDKTSDPIMALILGLATVISLLKTQGVMTEISYMGNGPQAVRKLSILFAGGISMMAKTARGDA